MPEALANSPAKIAGLRLQAARERANRKPADCAALLGISAKRYRELEEGAVEPDLPMLEQLAGYLQVPLPVLLGDSAPPREGPAATDQMALRARMIGAQLRQARIARDAGIDEVAKAIGLPPAQLLAIELAEQPLPISILRKLAGFHGMDIVTLTAPAPPSRPPKTDLENVPDDLLNALRDPATLPYLRSGLQLRGLTRKDMRRASKSLQKLAGILPK